MLDHASVRGCVPGVAFVGEGDAMLAMFDFCAGVGLGAFAVGEAFGDELGAGVGVAIDFEFEFAFKDDALFALAFEFDEPEDGEDF